MPIISTVALWNNIYWKNTTKDEKAPLLNTNCVPNKCILQHSWNLNHMCLRCCRSQWPRVLRRTSAVPCFWGLRVRIPQGAWLAVVIVACCQVEVSATDRSPVQRSPTESARAYVCVCVCLCVSVTECDQVQQWPSTPTMNRYKEIRLKWEGSDKEMWLWTVKLCVKYGELNVIT